MGIWQNPTVSPLITLLVNIYALKMKKRTRSKEIETGPCLFIELIIAIEAPLVASSTLVMTCPGGTGCSCSTRGKDLSLVRHEYKLALWYGSGSVQVDELVSLKGPSDIDKVEKVDCAKERKKQLPIRSTHLSHHCTVYTLKDI